jgi:AcrR family transcriptional regulator
MGHEQTLTQRLTAYRVRDNIVSVKLGEAIEPESRRAYRMRARAESAERTASVVMDAAIALWRERSYDEFTLREVADRAGVSLSTVMRRFGSKEGLAEAVLTSDRVGTQGRRDAVAAGAVDEAVRMILEEYEVDGDAVLRMLALEGRLDVMRRVVEAGRQAHEAWVARVFAPLLAHEPAQRRRQVWQLVIATDVQTWKLLRRDRRLTVHEARLVMTELCQAVVKETA